VLLYAVKVARYTRGVAAAQEGKVTLYSQRIYWDCVYSIGYLGGAKVRRAGYANVRVSAVCVAEPLIQVFDCRRMGPWLPSGRDCGVELGFLSGAFEVLARSSDHS
jgi:hypothetical protein